MANYIDIDHIDAVFDGAYPESATVTFVGNTVQPITLTNPTDIINAIEDYVDQYNRSHPVRTNYRVAISNHRPQDFNLNIQYRSRNQNPPVAGTNPPVAGTNPPVAGTNPPVAGTNPQGGAAVDEDEVLVGRRPFWKTKTGKFIKGASLAGSIVIIALNIGPLKRVINKLNPFAKSFKQRNPIVTDIGSDTPSYTGDQVLESSSSMVMLRHRIETISNETELLQVLNEINKLVSTHITEVNKLLTNGTFDCQPYALHLEELFEPGTNEYAVVQQFSALRDKVVVKRANALSSGKNEETVSKFKNSTTNYYNGYSNYSFAGQPWSNDIYVRYLDLSPMARYCIDALSLQMLTLSVPYSYDNLDKAGVQDAAQENLDASVGFLKQELGITGKHQ